MTSRPAIRGAESLTHPNGFRPSPKVQEHLGSGAALYATHDKAILGHQIRLVDRVVEGSIDRGSFVRSAGHLETFESQRAELRGGGVTRAERAELARDMKKLAGKMHATPQNQTEPSAPYDRAGLSRLFDELSQGVVSKSDAVEELNWRCQQAYGETAGARDGVVYADERTKVRASLVQGQNLHKPQWHRPGTMADQPAPLNPGTLALVRQALAVFPLLDQDSNGVVDRNEARSIITDYRALDLTAAQAATLYSRQALLAGVDSSGGPNGEMMAIEDLQALLPENVGMVDSGLVNYTLGQLSSRLTDQERRAMPRRMPLYLNEGDGPDGAKVGQGLEGSCWFLGVLPTLGAAQLEEILREEGEGYRMSFADGSSEFVKPLNPAERRVYSRGDGSWSGLMEKGMAQKLARTGDDIKGGLAQDALKALTGADCEVVFLNAGSAGGPDYRNKANLSELLQTTLGNGGALFTQVNSSDFDPEVSLVSEARHAYTITGYDAESETVSLRNPWGHGEKADRDGEDDGNFTMSLTEVASTFSLVIAEKPA